jgi:hypothetical protein
MLLPQNKESLKTWIDRLSLWTTFALALTVVFGFFLNRLTSRLTKIQEAEIATLADSTAQAIAKQKASDIELLKIKTDRTIPEKTFLILKEKLTKLGSGKHILISVSTLPQYEPIKFGKELLSLFREAGWTTPAQEAWTQTPPKGLTFVITDESQRELINKVVAIFVDVGYHPKIQLQPIDNRFVSLLVGEKSYDDSFVNN